MKKLNLKNVLFSVGMFVIALGTVGMFSVNTAEAVSGNTCLVNGTGIKAWFNASNWTGCGGGFPTSADTVQIPTNVALTLDSGNATVAAVIFDDPAATSSSLALNGYTLTVSGAVTLPASTGAGTATVVVGTGTLNAGSVSITGGGVPSGISSMTVGDGNIATTGNFSLLGASAITKALLTSTDAGSVISIGGDFINTLGTVTNLGEMTITGNLTGGGTVVNGANGILNLNGPTNTVTTLDVSAAGNSVTYGGADQTVIDTATHAYKNLYLAGSGTKTLTGITSLQGLVLSGTVTATTAANIAIVTNLIVGANTTLHLAGYTFGVGTTTDIYGTVDTTSVIGTKTFTGLVTVYSGANFDLSAFATPTVFSAGITNNSTLMNIGAGASTLVGNIAGTGAITWGGALTILSGTTTNSNTGIVTVTGALTLTGAWTQGTNSNLDLRSTVSAGTFTADTLVNTVTYGGTVQTVKTPAAGYYNLTLSGTGAKSFPASTLINQTLTVNTGSVITLLTSSLSQANKLYFGTAYQHKGTWSASTGGTGAHKSNTYFTSGVTYYMTVTLGKSTSYVNEEQTTTTCGSGYTLVSGVCTADTTTPVVTVTVVETPVVDPGCSGGNLYSTSTGKACVNNEKLEIPGCGNRDTGFSTSTGGSCVGNKVTTVTPPATTGVVKFTKALNNKSSLADVKNLQSALNALGSTLVVDGKWGAKTTTAVKAFQMKSALQTVGTVGPLTRAALNTALGL